MPSLALNQYALTVTHAEQEAELDYRCNVNTAANDTLEYGLTVTRGLATIVASPWYRCGAVVEMDLGDGNLTAIDPGELGPDLSISESFDGFADTLNFSLIGEHWSPWVRSIIRARLRVRVTSTLAIATARQSRVLFDGYIQSASFSGVGVASVTALDGAGAFVGEQIHIELPPNSNYTREYILFRYAITPLGIPVGRINLGPDGGGRIVKAISVSGVDALDWMREFVAACGAVLWFEDQKLYIEKLRPAAVADRTLTAIDMADDLDVTLPPTNNANVIVATGVVSPWLAAEKGTYTRRTVQTNFSVYTPLACIKKQSKIDGAVTDYAPSVSAADRSSEVIYLRTYQDGTLIGEEAEYWGWYALRAAVNKQSAAGVVSWNNDIDVYQYADGSWRSEPVQVWRKMGWTWRWLTYDAATGYLASEYGNAQNFYVIPSGAFATVATTAPLAYTYLASYVTDTGESWTDGTEVPPNVAAPSGAIHIQRFQYTTTFEVDADGFLARRETHGFAPGYFSFPLFAGDYAYHPEAERVQFTSGSRSALIWVASVSIEEWTRVGEMESRTRQVLTYSYGYHGSDTTIDHAFPPPRIAQMLSRQPPQLVRTTMTDAVSVALTGSHYYYIHDESAETTSELNVIAFEELRKRGAWSLSWTQPFDAILHKGGTVALSRPEIGLSTSALIWGVETSMNLATGDATSTVTAYYYTPELS